ncbi:hypothetical protein [Pleurocapsa sp. PCC 7327]|nr:hypothetical protein [Pleurocapsa sp. PCC 7327]
MHQSNLARMIGAIASHVKIKPKIPIARSDPIAVPDVKLEQPRLI